jgi:hypothetical protein
MTEYEKIILACKQRASEQAAEGSGIYYAKKSMFLESEVHLLVTENKRLNNLIEEKLNNLCRLSSSNPLPSKMGTKIVEKAAI